MCMHLLTFARTCCCCRLPVPQDGSADAVIVGRFHHVSRDDGHQYRWHGVRQMGKIRRECSKCPLTVRCLRQAYVKHTLRVHMYVQCMTAFQKRTLKFNVDHRLSMWYEYLKNKSKFENPIHPVTSLRVVICCTCIIMSQ